MASTWVVDHYTTCPLIGTEWVYKCIESLTKTRYVQYLAAEVGVRFFRYLSLFFHLKNSALDNCSSMNGNSMPLLHLYGPFLTC